MQKKSTTKAKSTRTKKRAAATRKTRTPSTRARRPKAKKMIAPQSNATLETKASPAITTRGPRPPKRSTLQRAVAKLGSFAGKIVRAIERK